MSDKPAPLPLHRSPFEGHKAGERPSAAGAVGVRLWAETLPGLVQVSTWPAGIASLRTALASAWGADAVPERPGRVVAIDAGVLMCTGPEEYLLLTRPGRDGVAELRGLVAADVGSVTDLGHARCRVRIEGPRCRDTLSKLFALDLREAALPVGEVRLSGHHHVPCTLHRQGIDRFDLLVFTTYADDQLGVLLDAAQEYGVALVLGPAPH